MSRTDLERGEGAWSLGVMTAIVEAPSLEIANRVAALLESEGIPAFVQESDAEAPMVLVPRAKRGRAWVAVPAQLRERARARILDSRTGLLLKLGATTAGGRPPGPRSLVPVTALNTRGAASSGGLSLRESRPSEAPPPSGEPPAPPAEEHEPWSDSSDTIPIDEGPIEPELPDSGPLAPRLAVASGAIVAGAVMQRALEQVMDTPRAVHEVLAATSAHAGEWWRYITAGFIHFSPEHLLGNAAFGLLAGVVLFGTHGIGAAMFTWLVGTAIGIFAEVSISEGAGYVAGASAGWYALVGLWAKGQLRDRVKVSLLPHRELMKTLGVLALLVPGALTPVTSSGSRVAIWAHAAGFIAGFLMGYVFERRIFTDHFPKIASRSRIGLAAAVGVTVAAFAWALPEIVLRSNG